ncbi:MULTISPECIES: hypothetical protein [Olivibacter]|uniref:Uncharacterized protein n=1 Tax=Olivibacter jilunii TaxID=985016 RepID=A0ABW6AWI9_9SPHI
MKNRNMFSLFYLFCKRFGHWEKDMLYLPSFKRVKVCRLCGSERNHPEGFRIPRVPPPPAPPIRTEDKKKQARLYREYVDRLEEYNKKYGTNYKPIGLNIH